jgi:hydroxyethylthiazole kinase-like uncharacterized protein yjeF
MTLEDERAPRVLDDDTLRAWPLPAADPEGDKDARGRVLVVAGSRETPGAALLAALSALRAGAGKVQVVTVEAVALPLALQLPEALVAGLPATREGGIDPAAVESLHGLLRVPPDVVLVGPGLRDEAAAAALVTALRRAFPQVPQVLDATAMEAVTQGQGDDGTPTVVTPHAGEMAHLTGRTKAEIVDDPRACAQQAARAWRSIVALKGATTWIAHPGGRLWRHDGGAPGLATAGSGDVLAGLIAAFASRGATLEQATAWGVVVHGLAGRRLSRRIGSVGFLARELADEVPALLDGLTNPDAAVG